VNRVDPRGAVRAAVLGMWAALFAWLWIDDAAAIYVGPRTSWIVPLGTIALTACATIALAGAFDGRTGPRPSPLELAGHAVLLAPILVVLVVDSPQLGASAASRKAGFELSIADLPDGRGDLDLVAVASANADPEIARALHVDRPGRRAAFLGIVTKREGAALEVTRFKIYCCAADAVPYTVRVDDPRGLAGDAGINQWVYVRGRLRRAPDGAITLLAGRLSRVEAPPNPYL
jgi:hypothetical protein